MARPEVEHIVTAKYMHGRCGARWVFPLALAVIPVMAEGQEPSSPPSPLVQDAPLTDFSLDLDESLDVGVAWPDLEAKSAEELAVVPTETPATVADSATPKPLPMEGEDLAQAEKETVATDDKANLADDGSEHRYRIVITGLEGVSDALFRERFNGLSVLQEQRGKPADATVADLAEDPDLLAEIGHAVAEANKAVSNAEAVKRFRVVSSDWTEDGGQLTPSMKLRRQVVMDEFAADVEALYR